MRMQALLFVALGLLSLGCSNPCDRLLKKVCDCPGIRAKAACSEAKERRKQKDAESRNKDQCRAALEALRCEDLK